MRIYGLLLGAFFFTLIGTDAGAYQFSVHQIAGYSKPLVLIMPDGVPAESIRKVHLHLHGWTQNPATGSPYQKDFDFEWKDPQSVPSVAQLRSFVENYGIHKVVEFSTDRAVVIPIARGRCDQYPELPGAMDDVSQKLFEESGIDPKQAVFDSASAHSGGGEVLARILIGDSVFKSVRQVQMIDAIYHDSTRDRLVDWLRSAPSSVTRTLEMQVIPGMKPQVHSKTILQGFKGEETKSDFQWNGSVFSAVEKKIQNGNSILTIEEKKPLKLDHWTIVKVAFDWFSNPETRRKPSSKKHSR
jgi:hypothetical protein